MKILVTGSSGHLGEALMRTYGTEGIEVLGIDIKASPFTDRVGSITDTSFVRDCMDGVDVVIHTATLHKPHIVTHTKQEFIDVNITGTLALLEAAVEANVQSFIFTSTTSTFGDAMRTKQGEPAAWVTEALAPIPKNIYGVTKIAAEGLCQIFHRNHGLPCLILRTSRFFLEEDDQKALRDAYTDANIKVNEYLYRRGDLEDMVTAHQLAVEKASEIGFGKYIISATSPFEQEDLLGLGTDAPSVLKQKFPAYEAIYAAQDWEMFSRIGRVYVNDLACKELGWKPKYDFQYILNCLKQGKEYRSPLSQLVRPKGYHEQEFDEGPYPVR